MEFWPALGIEQTKDTEAIKKAYYEKLKLVHPEEKPQEFMELRNEFEAAMKYAQQTDGSESSAKEKTAVDIWMEKVGAVYNEYPRRINLEEWKTLLADDVCQSLDSSVDARDALLEFIMDNFHMPQEVFQLLDKHFHLKASKDELYEKFPKDFIDNAIIEGIDDKPDVPCDLFDKSTTGNPDAYFKLFRKARSEIENGDRENAVATIADIEKSGIIHPYTDFLRAGLAELDGDDEKALSLLETVIEKCPGYNIPLLRHGFILRKNKRYDEAAKDYQAVIGNYPNHCQALFDLTECYMNTDRVKDAYELICQLARLLPHSNAVSARMSEVNKKMLDVLAEEYAQNPDDFECVMKYAWSLAQEDQFDKVRELTDPLVPSGCAQTCDLENLRTKLCLYTDDYEGALSHSEIWEKNVKQLPDGETDEEKKRKNKLGEIYCIQADSLCELERYDEALKKAEESKKAGDEKYIKPYETSQRIYSRTYQREKAIEEAEKIVEIKPNAIAYYTLAMLQYDSDRKQDAFYNLGEALEYDRNVFFYVLRAMILCDYEQWDDAEEIIKMLEENEIVDNKTRYISARIMKGRDKDSDGALKILNEIIRDFEEDENENSDFLMWDVYYEAAVLTQDKKADDFEAYEDIIAMLDKSLKIKEDYYYSLYFKAWLLGQMDKHDEEIEQNKLILKYYPKNQRANQRIANAYYERDDYETALEYCDKQLEIFDNANLHNLMGLCFMYLDRYEEAEEQFRMSIKLDPESIYPRGNLGQLYERQFKNERSLPLQQECVKINEKSEDKKIFPRRNLARVLARMGRYDEAVGVLEKNYELFSEPYDAEQIIYTRMKQGRLDLAEKAAEDFKKRNVININCYYNCIADIYRLRGDLNAFLKYTKKIPKDIDRIHGLAEYYLYIMDYKKANKYYDEIYKLDPDRAHTSSNRMYCLKRLGKKKQLEDMYKHALDEAQGYAKDRSSIPLYLTKLAFAHVNAGHPEKAKPLIEKALESPLCEHCKYNCCKDAYTVLAEYYEAMGEYDKAIETCRKGVEMAKDECDCMLLMYRIRAEHKNELKKENRK